MVEKTLSVVKSLEWQEINQILVETAKEEEEEEEGFISNNNYIFTQMI